MTDKDKQFNEISLGLGFVVIAIAVMVVVVAYINTLGRSAELRSPCCELIYRLIGSTPLTTGATLLSSRSGWSSCN